LGACLAEQPLNGISAKPLASFGYTATGNRWSEAKPWAQMFKRLATS
jgi:hypothetical protein